MAAWRCFVAVPLADELRGRLTDAVNRWRAAPGAPNLRWTDPPGWHVTLHFLGATDPAQIDDLRRTLVAIAARATPFTLASGGLGTFGGPAHARTLWYGVTDADGRLADLAAQVREAVGAEAGSFRPHVTLGRARDRRGVRLTGWLRGRDVPAGIVEVGDIQLLRSHLGPGPARYEVLASAPLGGAGSVHD